MTMDATMPLIRTTKPGTAASRGQKLRKIVALAKSPKTSQVVGEIPEMMMVDPETLFVDDRYQRSIRTGGMRLIQNMVLQWDWTKYKPPVATEISEGVYVIVDGQHTATAAATHPNVDKIPIFVVRNRDIEGQARAFVGHNKDRIPMKSIDIHRASVTSKDTDALKVEDILSAGGTLLIGQAEVGGTHKPNTTVAVSSYYWLSHRYGESRAKAVARTLGKCFLRPIRDVHIKAVAHLMWDEETHNVIDADKLATTIEAEHDGKTIGEAKQMASETGLTQWQCLRTIYYNRYRDTFPI